MHVGDRWWCNHTRYIDQQKWQIKEGENEFYYGYYTIGVGLSKPHISELSGTTSYKLAVYGVSYACPVSHQVKFV